MVIKICILIALLLFCFKHVDSVMTPTVEIKEEVPPKGSDRVRTNAAGETEIIGLVGEPVVLECLPTNVDENAKVLWQWVSRQNSSKGLFDTINDGMRAKDTSRWKITRGVSSKNAIRLEIPTVSTSYEGILQCRVYYQDDTQAVKAKRILLVLAKPRIIQFQSSFESVVLANRKASIRCNATGIPKPKIFWRRIGGSSSVIRGYGREFMGTMINFTQVKPDDRGTYLCKAINTMGEVKWPVKLNVLFKPIVSIYTGSVRAEIRQKIGCDMNLLCVVKANPAPDSITWTSNTGNSISDDKLRMRIYRMQAADYTTYYSVSFEPTRSSDFGKYSCTARNTHGGTTATVQFSESSTALPYRSGLIKCRATKASQSILLVVVVALVSLLRS